MLRRGKRRKYDFLGKRHHFVPVSVETSGVWSKEGLRFVREVGVRVAACTKEQCAPAFLLQRVSLTVQRGDVAAVRRTLPRGVRFVVFLL